MGGRGPSSTKVGGTDIQNGQELWPRPVPDVYIMNVSKTRMLCTVEVNRNDTGIFLFECCILPFCWKFRVGRKWEDGAEDGVPFSGTLGTHLTLAHSCACSTGSKHAEVWIQKCLCAAQANRRDVGSLINIHNCNVCVKTSLWNRHV